MAEHLYTYDDPCSEKDLQRICRVLEADGVIAYPSDVSWAFACDAASVKALDKIRKIKPEKQKESPFSIVCNDLSMASDLVCIENQTYRVLKKVLPGPYTIILERSRNLVRQLKDKRRVVGIRVPKSNLVLGLVQYYGKPLASTTVHELPSSGQLPRYGYEVEESFGHGIDMVVDLGQEIECRETTIIDCSQGEAELIREGAGDPNLFF